MFPITLFFSLNEPPRHKDRLAVFQLDAEAVGIDYPLKL
jgi:hypothetical protein